MSNINQSTSEILDESNSNDEQGLKEVYEENVNEELSDQELELLVGGWGQGSSSNASIFAPGFITSPSSNGSTPTSTGLSDDCVK